MMRNVLVALGCASLAAACIGGAEDEGPAPVIQSASANQAAAPKVTERSVPSLSLQEAPRVSRLGRETLSAPTPRPEAQDWKPTLAAIETVQDERGAFDPEAFAAMQDLRVWTGGKK